MSCYDCLSLDYDDTSSSCLAGDLANRFNWMCVRSRRITNVCSVCFSVNLPAFVPSENNTHTQNWMCPATMSFRPCVQISVERKRVYWHVLKNKTKTPLKNNNMTLKIIIVQELCESRGGRPGPLSVLTSLLVSVDVKLSDWTAMPASALVSACP